MKQFSLLLNGILLLAVAYLYYLHFSAARTTAVEEVKPIAVPATAAMSGGILYVNSDSLLDQYRYFTEKRNQLDARQEKIRSELASEKERLDAAIQQYQQQAVGMTDMERQKKEEELMMKQQSLMGRREKLLAQLDDEQAKSTEELFNRLTAFLRTYIRDKQINYVLGYQKGGGILFANDSLDITRQVVDGLNKEYAAEKK
jgi:outer membrane protein